MPDGRLPLLGSEECSPWLADDRDRAVFKTVRSYGAGPRS